MYGECKEMPLYNIFLGGKWILIITVSLSGIFYSKWSKHAIRCSQFRLKVSHIHFEIFPTPSFNPKKTKWKIESRPDNRQNNERDMRLNSATRQDWQNDMDGRNRPFSFLRPYGQKQQAICWPVLLETLQRLWTTSSADHRSRKTRHPRIANNITGSINNWDDHNINIIPPPVQSFKLYNQNALCIGGWRQGPDWRPMCQH